jgi:hypothetical protein
VHAAVMNELHNVINSSVEIEEHPDIKKKNNERNIKNSINDNVLMHRFAGAVRIDGRIYRVKTTMKEYQSNDIPNGHYTYEVTKIEVLNEIPPNTSNGRSNVSDVFVSGAKLLQNVEESYDNGKKLLEESKIADENSDFLFRNPDETDDKRLKNDAMRDDLKMHADSATGQETDKDVQSALDWIGIKSDDIRFKKDDGKTARERYENRLKRNGYKATEAYQDYMASVKVLQEELAKERGKEIADNENVYLSENQLSSVNKAEEDIFERLYYYPMIDALTAMGDRKQRRRYIETRRMTTEK